MTKSNVSKQTRNKWLIDAGLLSSALIAAISGIYFLFLPVGGYQGGRNPTYGIMILFERHTWEDIHTWVGVAMIAIALIHLILHWSWVVSMAKRTWKEWTGKADPMNGRGRYNLIVNTVIAVSFVLTALSGIYFLFFPGSGGAVTPVVLFSQAVWDLIHTWAGVALIIAAVLHFAIHWKWVTKVTRNVFQKFSPKKTGQQLGEGAVS